MDFKYLINRTNKTYTFAIYGEIGEDADVDGHRLAHEINYAGDYVDEINVRINSEGGNIIHGLSVFSALLNSSAKINIFIDGVAASMAGVIALAGDTIAMVDYGRLMVHDPSFANKDKLSEKEKKGLKSIRAMLVSIFVNRIGKDEAYMDKVMREETWYNAADALEHKFITKIITTEKKNSFDKLSLAQLVNTINKQKSDNMDFKEIAVKIGLAETATKEEVLAKLEEMEKNQKPPKEEKEELKPEEKMVAAFLAMGKKTGAITDKNEANMKKLAETNLELAIDMLDGMKAAGGDEGKDTLRISDLIAELKKGAGSEGKGDEKDYDWYQKNDTVALMKMKSEKPEDFKKLFEAKYGKAED